MRTVAPHPPRQTPRPPQGPRSRWLARRLTRPRAKTLVAIADASAVAVAAALCVAVVPARGDGITPWSTVPVIACAPAIWIFCLSRQRAYRARCIARRREEFRRVVRASGVAVAVLVTLAAAVGTPVARSWLIALPIFSVPLLMFEREIARYLFVRLRRKGVLCRPVVIVGTNQEALDIADVVSRDPSVGYRIVGFVGDIPLEVVDESIRASVLGTVADIDEVVVETGALGIVIASTAVTTAVSNRLARQMTRAGVHVELSATLRDVAAERLSMSGIGPFPMVYVEGCRRHGWRAVAKRSFDVAVASAVLALTAPAMLVVSVAVKLTSAGPVLFRQIRVGKDGELFEIFKFRTMVRNAEDLLIDLSDRNEADGPLFKIRNDPRMTPVGRLLRRTSIDELPQLWNVIRGEMSLVGPRPALPSEARCWAPELHGRLDVKPGITGMWQVNGRSESSFDEYVRLDLFYVDNWSLATDLGILMRTLPAVLSRRGAA